jgi:hypothetical protein
VREVQRKEAIAQTTAGNRPDIVEKEDFESKPHLVRLARNQSKLWIMIVPLLLLAWFQWHGKFSNWR